MAKNVPLRDAKCVIQGVPEKAPHFQDEITLEIWGQKAQFSQRTTCESGSGMISSMTAACTVYVKVS